MSNLRHLYAQLRQVDFISLATGQIIILSKIILAQIFPCSCTCIEGTRIKKVPNASLITSAPAVHLHPQHRVRELE